MEARLRRLTRAYAFEASALRRHYDMFEGSRGAEAFDVCRHRGVLGLESHPLDGLTGFDSALAWYAILMNYRYAKLNANKWLLRDELGSFPVVNYITGEMPYIPGADARFGREDYHYVVDTRENLVYFQQDSSTGLLIDRII